MERWIRVAPRMGALTGQCGGIRAPNFGDGEAGSGWGSGGLYGGELKVFLGLRSLRFERRLAEPDAFLEDLVRAIGGNQTGPHYFLRHLQKGASNIVTAAHCTTPATAARQARTTTCATRNTAFDLPGSLLALEGATPSSSNI